MYCELLTGTEEDEASALPSTSEMAVDMTPPPSTQWRGAIPRLQQSRVSPIRQPNFDGAPKENIGGDAQADIPAAKASTAGAALLKHMYPVEELATLVVPHDCEFSLRSLLMKFLGM